MITFLILAAALTVAAAAALVWPLLRARDAAQPAAWTALAVAAVLLIGGGGLYWKLSNWSWSQRPESDSAPTMVAQLVRRLNANPNDREGWMQLGRSYMALEQLPLAIRAFERANSLADGKRPEVLIALGEALTNQDDTALTGRAGHLFEQALQLEPRSPKAIFYAAAAALRRGELPLARERFAALLALNPPENVRPIIQQQIDAIDQRLAASSAASVAPGTAGAPHSGAAGGGPSVRVTVRLSPSIKLDPGGSAPLFVFVRDPKQPGPPLAVKRLSLHFPQTVELTPADAMVAGRAFAAGQDVEVVARIGRSGGAIAKSGDPFGQAGYRVGRDGVVDVQIDRLTP